MVSRNTTKRHFECSLYKGQSNFVCTWVRACTCAIRMSFDECAGRKTLFYLLDLNALQAYWDMDGHSSGSLWSHTCMEGAQKSGNRGSARSLTYSLWVSLY
jgi:hypothetical protein